MFVHNMGFPSLRTVKLLKAERTRKSFYVQVFTVDVQLKSPVTRKILIGATFWISALEFRDFCVNKCMVSLMGGRFIRQPTIRITTQIWPLY